MALHVKSIDPDHLLEVGTEGYYGPSSPTRLQDNANIYSGQFGADFIRNHRVHGIDFASVHMYPELWLAYNFFIYPGHTDLVQAILRH